MIIPGYYDLKHKLEEGKTYIFRYLKQVILSDGEAYMVMEDPFGIRHMLLYRYYQQFNLQPDSAVRCRVDKINCTGRVFLEPEHPYYKPGTTGFFAVVWAGFRTSGNSVSRTIVVRDIFNNEVEVIVPPDYRDNLRAGARVVCAINDIRKGRPELSLIQ
ncbi:hypothetical protein TBC1_12305 [Lentimicrobium saccharophilum]|uniref:Uncharacterized protein n=1 Tax=Lentimicrobium saccharophilum TaxID=1678841 RepID=A0A0S7C2Z7_9BACT|nr:hypothetical protein [Lentimicrobium saccharophilum]GAP44497.1 hypothetical protein TBC1_12305 [Lentimicrobium saccharophilum]